MSQHKPPRKINYPVYSEQQKEQALLEVCRFLLQRRARRLAREKLEQEQANDQK